jgi:hypothetical protein
MERADSTRWKSRQVKLRTLKKLKITFEFEKIFF